MLTKQFSELIEPTLYFDCLASLAARGIIGRTRGRGGSIFLAANPGDDASSTHGSDNELNDKIPEAELMYPTMRFLKNVFAPNLDLPEHSEHFVVDASSLGPPQGEWSRPDFLVVTLMHFQIVPGSQLDIHSIELKNESGGSVQAVHEALAQTRFTNFGHLVWHLPFKSLHAARLPAIQTECMRHGIGLILIREPNKPELWETILDAEYKDTSPAIIDAFLLSRLPPVYLEIIRSSVRGRSNEG